MTVRNVDGTTRKNSAHSASPSSARKVGRVLCDAKASIGSVPTMSESAVILNAPCLRISGLLSTT
jgi:hypothetical protein